MYTRAKSFRTTADLKAGARVTLLADGTVRAQGAGERGIGVAGTASAGGRVIVDLDAEPEKRLSANAFGAGVSLFEVDGGKVSDRGSTPAKRIALEPATAADQRIEVMELI